MCQAYNLSVLDFVRLNNAGRLIISHLNVNSLKSDSHQKMFSICFIESSLKMIKNAFYFILKTLFVLKIFKFLPWLFGHVGKTFWLER